MSAEVQPDQSSTPDPGPIRKKKFKVSSLLGILIILLALGYTAKQIQRTTRNQKVTEDFFAWTKQLATDNPSVSFRGFTAGTSDFGATFHYEGKYSTPTKRTIAIDFNHSERLFDRSGRLILSAEGRSVTWPVEDVERGRKVDLMVEFPEAFR